MPADESDVAERAEAAKRSVLRPSLLIGGGCGICRATRQFGTRQPQFGTRPQTIAPVLSSEEFDVPPAVPNLLLPVHGETPAAPSGDESAAARRAIRSTRRAALRRRFDPQLGQARQLSPEAPACAATAAPATAPTAVPPPSNCSPLGRPPGGPPAPPATGFVGLGARLLKARRAVNPTVRRAPCSKPSVERPVAHPAERPVERRPHAVPFLSRMWRLRASPAAPAERQDSYRSAGARAARTASLERSAASSQAAALLTQVQPAGDRKLDRLSPFLSRAQFQGLFPPPPGALGTPRPLLGPQFGEHAGRHTLVLDLDETLIHSSFIEVPHYSFIITVEIEGTEHLIYVAKRPGVDEFLDAMAKNYEVIIFTASLAKYADPLMDCLDPKGCCVARLFREQCVFWGGQYVKDLSRLGRDMRKILIVDNSPSSYAFQPENALPIESWFDDLSDTELIQLVPILEALAQVDNIPAAIRESLLLQQKS